MKLIIQIPCYNEESNLETTLKNLPTTLEGIDKIELQIVNDGSTDATETIAKKNEVDHIISFKKNKGLAAVFKAGMNNALVSGADILVNTDADNQYCADDIEKLVRPILEGSADIVIGARPILHHPEFSKIKKILQLIGSYFIRVISKTEVKDAPSGFRAYSRQALMHLNILTDFSYTLETIIQSGMQNLKIKSVDIRINPKVRESRLFKSLPQYVMRSLKTIFSVLIIYRPHYYFTCFAIILFIGSLILLLRFMILVHFWNSPANMFWPSLILSLGLLLASVQVYMTGIVAFLISVNRKMLEDINYRVRKLELDVNR
ncbi:MAG: glycosyltransferase family 2 protein [Oligoflexia bacterium]|nr:glycosyltransferase family 2 protein [Oligoflexia bacterium]